MKVFKRTSQKGFTLIEMLVVAPIVILTIGAFLTVIISMTGEVLASRASNNLSYNVQDALDHIEQDVKMSNSFLATNTVLGTNQGYNDDATAFTNVGGSSGTSLILNAVATTANPVSTNNSYVYLLNQPNACATAVGNNIPFTYNIVYFVKNNNLYRRTIMPTNYTDTTNTVCSIPWQQPSCSPTYMDAQSGSVFCKTKDVELVDGVMPGNFTLQYFNGEANATENTPASSTSASTADRNTALLSATTVGVTIDAQQTTAGRPIERVAILRASRLDQNASAIATVTTDGAPSAPKVTSSTGEPTNAIFSWSKVTSATGYTFEYQINGGSWTAGFTNQPTQTYTVTTATHKDVVNARVTAINGAGNSGYGTSTVTIPLWTPLNLQNGWVDYGVPYTSAAYTKTSAGVIVLKGMIRTGSVSAPIAILPLGYRPSGYIMFENASNDSGGRLDVRSDGTISVSIGSNPYLSLDEITFMPASATFTPATFANGWGNYSPASGDPNWQNAGYLTDGAGRTQITGLIRNGTTTSGTPFFTLPSAMRNSEYQHILNNDGGAATHFSIDTSGNVVAKGYANGDLSLQDMFFPSSRSAGSTCTTQWCTPSLLNSWHYYGAPYSTPGYTKSSDGLVLLKGLLNGGSSATALVMTLPAGYCPADRLLVATASNGVFARMDIIRNGDGTCTFSPGAGASTSWLSLDDLRYMAEP